MSVDAVENAAVAREVKRDKGEDGGERRGIQFRVDEKLVGAERDARTEPLLLLEEGWLGVHEF